MGIGVGGGYKSQTSTGQDRITYDPWTDWTRGAAYDWLTQPGNIPGAWTGGGNLGGLDIPFTGQAAQRLLSTFSLDPTAAEQRGADEFRKATDLEGLEQRAGAYFQSIAAPQVRNALAATGGGRSGAVGENLSRAGTEMAVPLASLANQRQAEYGQLLAGLGSGAAARLLSALGASGQLGLGMGQLQNQRDIAGSQINAGQMTQILGLLANLLRPLETQRRMDRRGHGWDVNAQAQYGMSGLNQGGGGSAPNMFGPGSYNSGGYAF